VGSNPTLSATSFIFLYSQALVSIMVSALRWFPASYRRESGLQTEAAAEKLASIF
jgi:hypothetical protein